MRLVERMSLPPYKCLKCGCGNVANNDRTVGPFLDLESDINFGDSAYLCMSCFAKAAATMGYMTPEDHSDKVLGLTSDLRKVEGDLHDLQSKYEQLHARYMEAKSKLETLLSAKRILKQESAKASERPTKKTAATSSRSPS